MTLSPPKRSATAPPTRAHPRRWISSRGKMRFFSPRRYVRNIVNFTGTTRNRPSWNFGLQRVEVFAWSLLGPKVRRLRLHHRRIQQITVDTNVEKFWLRTLLGFSHAYFVHRDSPANLAVWIIQIPGKNRLSRADDFASRLVAHLNARGVEITLGSGVALRVNVKRVVRTSLHAGLTADAALVIEVDDTV